jgi:hypothetical protein
MGEQKAGTKRFRKQELVLYLYPFGLNPRPPGATSEKGEKSFYFFRRNPLKSPDSDE